MDYSNRYVIFVIFLPAYDLRLSPASNHYLDGTTLGSLSWTYQTASCEFDHLTPELSLAWTGAYCIDPASRPSFYNGIQVIAEVIGGVILGPTVMGRIPNFSASVFPEVSLPYLNLTATIGLVLFLFLTALEVDPRIIMRNAKSSTFISLAGIALPFAMGAGIAVPVYHNFVSPSVNFSYFILFTGVAMSITAFPVLCRILTELKLLNTNVGVIVLSAGVGNDVVGWVLLALTSVFFSFFCFPSIDS